VKPLALRLQAFGPYAREVALDFDTLADHPLFLICGPTGAGKSTLLDAICYALYGQTSGGERTAEQMRCQQADPATRTTVTLDFALGDRRFRVRREPEQERPKKRGQGFTTHNPTAELQRLDADEPDVLATGVTDVNARVVSLLGFRADQFRQVIMLPQGRFRQFLSATSGDREIILETLFGTEIYKQIEQALRKQANAAAGQAQQTRTRLATILAGVDAQTPDDLVRLQERARSLAGRQRDRTEQATGHLQAANAAFEQATRDATLLRQAREATDHLERLTSKSADVERDRDRLALADRAAACLPAMRRLDEAKSEVDRQAVALDRAEAEAKRAADESASAGHAKAEADQAAHACEKLLARVRQIDERLARLDDVRQAEAGLEDARSAETAAETLRAKAASERETALEEADAAQESADAAGRSAARIDPLRFDADAASQALTAHDDATRAEQAAQKLDSTAAGSEAEAVTAGKERDEIRRRWRDGVAARLAGSLVPGEACPVCGSTKHPTRARPDDAGVDDAALERAEQRAEQENAKAIADRRSADAARERAAARREQADRLAGGPQQSRSNLLAAVEAARSALAEAEHAAELAMQQRTAAEQARLQADKLLPKLQALQARSDDARQARAVAEGRLTQTRFRCDEPAVPPATLEAERDRARSRASALQQAAESARDRVEAADKALAVARTKQEAQRQACDAAGQVLDRAAGEASAALADHQWASREEAQAARLDDAVRSGLARQVEAFDIDFRSAQQRRDDAARAAVGAVEHDLCVLEQAKTSAQQRRDRQIARRERLAGMVKQFGQARRAYEQADAEGAWAERRYGVLKRLCDLAAGTNAKQLRFHRFVLSHLLDTVLETAGRRLSLMTAGRYRLQRAATGKKGGDLSVDVFDAHTGRPRPAGTLSGGEGFLASLSLALGLADVVQARTGGVRLDAVFIDEGFGTLDADALDTAMNALSELTGDRLVGLISHVGELKNRIPAKLVVEPGPDGSTARFVT
jgi:exonuclease SbcC